MFSSVPVFSAALKSTRDKDRRMKIRSQRKKEEKSSHVKKKGKYLPTPKIMNMKVDTNEGKMAVVVSRIARLDVTRPVKVILNSPFASS